MPRRTLGLIVAIALLASTNLALLILPLRTAPAPDLRAVEQTLSRLEGWKGVEGNERPESTGFQTLLSRRLVTESPEDGSAPLAVDVDILHWPRFTRNGEVFASQHLGTGTRTRTRRARTHSLAGDGSERIASLLLSTIREQRVVFYWYLTPEGVVASKTRGRVDLALRALTNRRTDVTLFRVLSSPLDKATAERDRRRVKRLAKELARTVAAGLEAPR